MTIQLLPFGLDVPRANGRSRSTLDSGCAGRPQGWSSKGSVTLLLLVCFDHYWLVVIVICLSLTMTTKLMVIGNNTIITTPGCWPTPLKNDGVRQLGWWHSQYMDNKNVPNHQPDYHGEVIIVSLFFNVIINSIFNDIWFKVWSLQFFIIIIRYFYMFGEIKHMKLVMYNPQ